MLDTAMHDVIIIGKGPAGLQAAIYLARTRLDMLVVGHGGGNLAKAAEVNNYFGFAGPVSGASLLRAGEEQARSLGARFIDAQAVGAAYADGGFEIRVPGVPLLARTVLLATGASLERPPIEGISDYEGKGVSYCAVCDGYFYRGKKAGVLGYSDYALREAIELADAGADVTIFPNGRDMVASEAHWAALARFRIEAGRVAGLMGEDGRFCGLRLENGAFHALDGLFIAYGIAGSADFAKKLGLAVGKDGSILVDAGQRASIHGIFAAGDCTGSFRQIAVAVGQGALAARSIIEYCAAR